MNQKGQVTIFIIIAIFIIAGVILFFSFKDSILNGFARNNDLVYLYIENCIKETAEDGILYVIRNGGYLFPISLSTSEGLPYYYYNGKNYVPTKERIEEEISSYVENTLSFCIDDFANFPSLNITAGKVESTSSINLEEIIFNVKYPVMVKKEETVTRFTDFNNIRITSGVGIMHDSISKIISEQIGESQICISCMSEIAEEERFKIEMTNTEEAIIFSLIDEHSKIKDTSLEWRFANEY